MCLLLPEWWLEVWRCELCMTTRERRAMSCPLKQVTAPQSATWHQPIPSTIEQDVYMKTQPKCLWGEREKRSIPQTETLKIYIYFTLHTSQTILWFLSKAWRWWADGALTRLSKSHNLGVLAGAQQHQFVTLFWITYPEDACYCKAQVSIVIC